MLVIIIVSWNVRDRLRQCLSSLRTNSATVHPQQILVVDNASEDGSAEMVRVDFPDVHLITNTTNRGFTGGNNDGLTAAEIYFTQSEPGKSYTFLLNPDTVVTAGALDTLLNYADVTPDTAIIGPQLLFPDGSIQSSRRRFPNLATSIFESTWLQPLAPHSLLDRYYMGDKADSDICDVDWVYGAAMLVRRSAYRQVGLLDDSTFFMYSEEVDWCKRIKMTPLPQRPAETDSIAFWRVVYHPGAKIIHYEAQSSNQVSARRMILFNTSKVRYLRKYHGKLQAAILRLVLLSLFAVQFIVESVKWLLGHKRSLRSERMSAYRSVLQSGLS